MKLNLGCSDKKIEGFTNIDIDSVCNPDICIDVADGLPFDDGQIEEVRAFDFLEHIPIGKTIFVIDEIWRVLEQGGKFEHFTPSTDGRGAFQDPTHQSFWNINSWLYFTKGNWSGHYGIKAEFTIEHLVDVITSNELHIVHTHGILRKERS